MGDGDLVLSPESRFESPDFYQRSTCNKVRVLLLLLCLVLVFFFFYKSLFCSHGLLQLLEALVKNSCTFHSVYLSL